MSAEPSSITCTSTITGVVVHRRGAIVTRRVLVDALPDGDVECVVGDITTAAEAGSVRIKLPPSRVAGTGGAEAEHQRRLVGVRSAFHLPEAVGKSNAALKAVEELAEQVTRAKEERQVADRVRSGLESWLAEPQGRKALRELGPLERTKSALKLSSVVRERLVVVTNRIFALDQELEELTKRLAQAMVEEAQVSDSPASEEGRPTRRFLVHLAGAGSLEEFSLSYTIPLARWWPQYSLRLSEGGREAKVCIEALVAQCSGEDWTGVSIALSTAALTQDMMLPRLESIRLGRAQPPSKSGFREPPEDLDRLFACYDAAQAARTPPPPPPAVVPTSRPRPAPVMAKRKKAAYPEPEAAMEAGPWEGDPFAVPYADGPVPTMAAMAPPTSSRSNPLSAGWGAAQAAIDLVSRAGSSGGSEGMRSRSATGGPPPPAPPAPGAPAPGAPFPGAPAPVPQARLGRPEPDDDWLDFDSLSLGGAQSQHRGRLQKTGAESEFAGQSPGTLSRAVDAARERNLIDPEYSAGHFDYRFEPEGRVDIPSDGLLHHIDVVSSQSKSRLGWCCVPRKELAVFREALVENTHESPLLSSNMNVYVDGRYLTQTRIEKIDAGGRFRVGLGVDERIAVVRNVRMSEESAGLLGNKRTLEHSVEIELRSGLGFESVVEVIDRIPVTDEQTVDIELTKESIPSVAYDQEEYGAPVRGGRCWKATLEAGGRQTIQYTYRIELRAKDQIQGGNRRE